MTRTILAVALPAALGLAGLAGPAPDGPSPVHPPAPPARLGDAALSTLALRVHRMAEMERFYQGAFGVRFRDVPTGPVTSRFGELGGITLKLVPIREGVDFEGFPVHQPGFTVPDVERVMELAEAYGGQPEGQPVREADVVVRASVRDPDGNTIELYRGGPTPLGR